MTKEFPWDVTSGGTADFIKKIAGVGRRVQWSGRGWEIGGIAQ